MGVTGPRGGSLRRFTRALHAPNRKPLCSCPAPCRERWLLHAQQEEALGRGVLGGCRSVSICTWLRPRGRGSGGVLCCVTTLSRSLRQQRASGILMNRLTQKECHGKSNKSQESAFVPKIRHLISAASLPQPGAFSVQPRGQLSLCHADPAATDAGARPGPPGVCRWGLTVSHKCVLHTRGLSGLWKREVGVVRGHAQDWEEETRTG